MKRLFICLMIFVEMSLLVSCTESGCVPEGPFATLHLSNASTHSVVVEIKVSLQLI